MGKIVGVGFAVTAGRFSGGYDVRCWVRCDEPQASTQEDYRRLLFTELIDVILVHLDHYRPGDVIDAGWTQPALDGI